MSKGKRCGAFFLYSSSPWPYKWHWLETGLSDAVTASASRYTQLLGEQRAKMQDKKDRKQRSDLKKNRTTYRNIASMSCSPNVGLLRTCHSSVASSAISFVYTSILSHGFWRLCVPALFVDYADQAVQKAGSLFTPARTPSVRA